MEKGDALVEAQGLGQSFGPKRVLDGVSLTLRAGEVTGFVGANGAGKTTTIQLMLGLLRGDGRTLFLGRPLYEWGAPGTVVGAVMGAWRATPSTVCARICAWWPPGRQCRTNAWTTYWRPSG